MVFAGSFPLLDVPVILFPALPPVKSDPVEAPAPPPPPPAITYAFAIEGVIPSKTPDNPPPAPP